MSKYIDTEKLIAELRKHLMPTVLDRDYDEWERGRDSGFIQAIGIVESLQQEQPSLPSNLEKAAEEYSENILANNEDLQDAIEDAFKAGAEWMAWQGQTNVELEEEITRWLEKGDITDTRFGDYDDADIERTARYFYELGLNAG